MSALGNQFKTVLLLGVLTALLLFVGQLVGGMNGLLVGLVFAVVMNLFSYLFSDRIVLAMYRAKPADKKDYPVLHRIAEEVAQLAEIPKPKLYIINNPTPNAFATGRGPKKSAVACTDGILRLLSKDELKGVIAHEMSHIKNRDILVATIAATIAGVISYVAMMARWAAIFGGFGNRDRDGGNILSFLFLAIVTPLIAVIIQLAISRSREYLADETGAKMINNPRALASALEKLEGANMHMPMRSSNTSASSLFIVNPFRGNALVRLFSTHPPIQERVRRLNEMD